MVATDGPQLHVLEMHKKERIGSTGSDWAGNSVIGAM